MISKENVYIHKNPFFIKTFEDDIMSILQIIIYFMDLNDYHFFYHYIDSMPIEFIIQFSNRQIEKKWKS